MDFIDEKGRYYQYQKLCHCSHKSHCNEKCTAEGCNCQMCSCLDCDHPNVVKSQG